METPAADQYVADQTDLLTLESEAQGKQTRARFRSYPSEVQAVSQTKGNLGGTVISVVPLGGQLESMKAGSWIELSAVGAEQKTRGLVISHESGRADIHVPLAGVKEGEVYRVRGVPHNFQRNFQQNLEGIRGMARNLREVLLGGRPLDPTPVSGLDYQDPKLDPSQQSAVSFVMSRPDLALVWGPPGSLRLSCMLISLQVFKGQERPVLLWKLFCNTCV